MRKFGDLTMSVRHSSSLPSKLRALALVDHGSRSIREIAADLQIPKSTLHDNLPIYRRDVARFMEWQDESDRHLVRNILIQMFDGKTSSRACAITLSKLMNMVISHQQVLRVLDLSAGAALEINTSKLSLKTVSCAAFDEIFQRQQPILGFADPFSALIYISDTDDRSGNTWASFLTSLKRLGLDPVSTVTDGGSGLLCGIRQVFSESIPLRDLFHFLHKLSKAKRILEGKCYAMIAAEVKLCRSSAETKDLEILRIKVNEALFLFDQLEAVVRRLNNACYFAPNESPCYVTAEALRAIVSECIDVLGQAQQKISDHRSIKAAITYLKSGSKSISAYKDMLEKSVAEIFGPLNSSMVLQFICPIIESLDQYHRSHDSKEKQRFWGQKIAALRASFRSCLWIDQDEVDRAITMVSKLMDEVKKSNSLMESVNSVIRCHLQTYKSIPRWFCSIFTFFWNHRKFSRGKRKGMSPLEIASGKPSEGDWIDLLLASFPFQELHLGTKSMTQAADDEKNPAA